MGGVLVARTDPKPLYKHHLRLIIRYTREIETLADLSIPYNALEPLVARMLAVEKIPWSAQDILASITPGEFKEYYVAQCQLK